VRSSRLCARQHAAGTFAEGSQQANSAPVIATAAPAGSRSSRSLRSIRTQKGEGVAPLAAMTVWAAAWRRKHRVYSGQQFARIEGWQGSVAPISSQRIRVNVLGARVSMMIGNCGLRRGPCGTG